MLRITKDPNCATAITHAGTFHADEVFATAILVKRFPNLVICRVTEVPEKLHPNTIVFDIGCGRYDHHQPEGAGERPNGVPYAACGLIWKRFGREILSYMRFQDVYSAWKYIDTMLIQGIDAADNGVLPTAEYPSQALTVSAIITGFNRTWDENFDQDDLFMKAVRFATTILDNLLRKIKSSLSARVEIKKAFEKCEGPILVLDKYLPWPDLFKDFKEETSKYLFVVYPSNRGGWSFSAISNGAKNVHRKDVPKEWWGLNGQELRNVTGIPSAIFVHAKGFMGGAETKEDTIRMATLAVAA